MEEVLDMVTNVKNTFLSLIRLGIGHPVPNRFGKIDWKATEALAEQQGLLAILVDGVEKLPDDHKPSKLVLLQWIGESLQEYEYRYELYQRAISELAGWYNAHGFKMMVLKGYACSSNWPKPEHRPCGDIDIWLFGQQKEADATLFKEKGIKVDNSYHHHTVFYWHDFMVENHYDFINVHARSSNVELEKVFKKLGADDSHSVEVNGERVYLPSPNLHALFLVRHNVAHFTSASVSLRQILDWAFFVEKHTKEIDWVWLVELLKKNHMLDLYNTINAICVDDLGFDAKIFPYVKYNPVLKEKVLDDILYPQYTADEPSCLIPRLIYKYKRWNGNRWKHELCYKESMWSVLWSSTWSHLLKPSSI